MTPELQQAELWTLMLQFIGSLTLCDHMGDVSNDVNHVIKRLGLDFDESDSEEWGAGIRRGLGKMGVTSLYGTKLSND